jgi:hypothetical protein
VVAANFVDRYRWLHPISVYLGVRIMIFPLSDTEDTRYGTTPMSTIIILIGVLIWNVQTPLLYMNPSSYNQAIYYMGASSAHTLTRQGLGGLTAITATLMHGGFFHLFSKCGPFVFLVVVWKMPAVHGVSWQSICPVVPLHRLPSH